MQKISDDLSGMQSSSFLPLPSYPPPYDQTSTLLKQAHPEEAIVASRRKVLFVVNVVFLWLLIAFCYTFAGLLLSAADSDGYFIGTEQVISVYSFASIYVSIALYTFGSVLMLWSTLFCAFGSCVPVLLWR